LFWAGRAELVTGHDSFPELRSPVASAVASQGSSWTWASGQTRKVGIACFGMWAA
jgi:hypothetical protein